MVAFRVLRGGRRVKSRLTNPDFRKADSSLLKDLLGRILWDNGRKKVG